MTEGSRSGLRTVPFRASPSLVSLVLRSTEPTPSGADIEAREEHAVQVISRVLDDLSSLAADAPESAAAQRVALAFSGQRRRAA